MRRIPASLGLALLIVFSVVSAAWGCAGLVAPNGSVRLLRTATLAGYHNGIEHYITSFEFKGGGAKFGSIVPLPDIPKRVSRAGKWTLQRLQQEVAPPAPAAAEAGGDSSEKQAEELYETEIDGLKITILRGGARAVGNWAKNEGFALTPDAPEVLHFYSQRSKIFMAARFVPEKAENEENLEVGDGVPIHLRIPTDNPWVPLRILALGKRPAADVTADVFLLTDIEPAILPQPVEPGTRGLILERSEQASDSLMRDLSSDRGMGWMPEDMWFTYLRVDSNARRLTYDMAIDASGEGQPDPEDAYGQQDSGSPSPAPAPEAPLGWLLVVPTAGLAALIGRKRSSRRV